MIKEVIAKGATIDIAIENGVEEIGVDKDLCQIEILETPKRTLFGKSKQAVVKVTTEIVEEVVLEEPLVVPNDEEITADIVVEPPVQVEDNSNSGNETKTKIAVSYLKDILKSLELEHITMTVEENDDCANINFDGEGMAVLIGHHGETLDAIQYLTTLTANRDDSDYYRISLDCGNYRQKRENTLQNLAKRMGEKVARTGRSQLLEPMNPYERKVIHAVIADMEGVYSKSKGDEPSRKVLILPENSNKRKNDTPERTMEQILKDDSL